MGNSSRARAIRGRPGSIPFETIKRRVVVLRGRMVILDEDLAALFGVETRALNQAVKRNRHRFPGDFLFDLTREEIMGISQCVTSSGSALGKLRFAKSVNAFTEHAKDDNTPLDCFERDRTRSAPNRPCS